MSNPIIDPVVVTNTILAAKFKTGAIIILDNLATIGRYKKFQSISRITKLNSRTLLAFSGEVSDFQKVLEDLEQKKIFMQQTVAENYEFSAKEIFCYLTEIINNKRRERAPLYNEFLVAGFHLDDKGENSLFMGLIDHLGNSYEDDILCTGMSRQLSRPTIEKAGDDKENVLKEMLEAFKINFLRKTNTIENGDVGIIELKDGIVYIEMKKLEVQNKEYFLEDIKAEL